ncbi:hypothetical protein BOTCAL_0124g00240 [Botryotinia calthae]|uniref:Uncharacterized protein n=1 Tax=Botryotinia calthae TaxID=38488 RepID=A0A4Y8D4B8_9HELO|nr:hypothetical protein BOTCAL_0124g00240 [Botryotinia calthae]
MPQRQNQGRFWKDSRTSRKFLAKKINERFPPRDQPDARMFFVRHMEEYLREWVENYPDPRQVEEPLESETDSEEEGEDDGDGDDDDDDGADEDGSREVSTGKRQRSKEKMERIVEAYKMQELKTTREMVLMRMRSGGDDTRRKQEGRAVQRKLERRTKTCQKASNS